MKFLSDRIDRFCYKHSRFGITNLMTILVVCTCVVYVLDLFSGSTLSAMLCFSRYYIFRAGQIWRLATFVIVPGSSGFIWFVIEMYFYWFIGRNLEQEWGSGKFTIYYLTGWVLTAITGSITGYATISYVNLSLFLAFATLYPNLQFRLFFFIPIKSKWLAWFYVAMLAVDVFLYSRQGAWYAAILIVVSLINYLIFFWSDLMYYLRRGSRNTRRRTANYGRQSQRGANQGRQSQRTTDFRKAAQNRKETRGYIHKCAVCGRTDTDFPDLEFRYCSKCVGYYCYCMDHINNHVHVRE